MTGTLLIASETVTIERLHRQHPTRSLFFSAFRPAAVTYSPSLNMSEDGHSLTPTNLRTLSVPATPGGSPAAPFKKQICAPQPEHEEGERAESISDIPGPRKLSSAFDSVASKPGVSIQSAASLSSAVDYPQEDNQSHSLSLPLTQAPVTPSALPQASISERANGLSSLEDTPGTPPSDEPLRENPKPTVGAPVASDKAEVCPPSPPQSIRSTSGLASVPTKETLLGMTYKGATLPHDDTERLRTVALLGILDQPEDPVLASITKLIVRLLKVSTVGEQRLNHLIACLLPYLLHTMMLSCTNINACQCPPSKRTVLVSACLLRVCLTYVLSRKQTSSSLPTFSILLLSGINIIDRDRLWWPSISTSTPLPAHGWSHPRQIGFCSYTLLAEAAEVLVVEDASKDHRYNQFTLCACSQTHLLTETPAVQAAKPCMS